MKKIKYLLFSLLVFGSFTLVSNAASLTVSTNKKTVVVGSTVTVTVTASGASGWEYCLNYNTSVFSLVSSNSDTGGACVRTGSTLTGYSKVTYTLKASKSGSGNITVKDYAMYGDDGGSVATSVNSVSVTAKTQAEIEASYSTNANLKNLTVDGFTISPEFSKSTFEYELEVENDVEKVNIIATKEDSKSSVSGAGEIELTEGLNKIEVVVTAEKGNKNTYVLNITRKELNPIYVTVDGKKLSIVRKAETLEAPTYYTSGTIVIQDEEVPSFSSEITGFTLVGLKDDDGNIKLYSYNNGEYKEYNQITSDNFIFIPIEITDTVAGYDKSKEVRLGDITIQGFYKNEDSDFVLIYGMNGSTGDKSWYQYDVKEGTYQRFENTEVVKLQEDLKDYLMIIIIVGGCLGLSLLSVILLLITCNRVKKKNVKLMAVLENGQVINKEFVVEEVPSTNEIDSKEVINELNEIDPVEMEKASVTISTDEEEIDEKEEVKEEPKKRGRRKRKEEVVEENDDDEPTIAIDKTDLSKFDKISDIDETRGMEKIVKEEINEEIVEEPVVEEKLSKRELRRLEKEQKKKEEEALKRAREEFLSDDDTDSSVFDDVDGNKKSLDEILAEKKKKKKK